MTQFQLIQCTCFLLGVGPMLLGWFIDEEISSMHPSLVSQLNLGPQLCLIFSGSLEHTEIAFHVPTSTLIA